MTHRPLCAISLLLALVAGCRAPERALPVPPAARDGDEIVVCGEHFDIGTPVVLWTDPGGYDAYSELPRFEPAARDDEGEPIRRRRYGSRKDLPPEIAARVAAEGWTRADLSEVVTQFVVHYDVCGTSRQCFKILQDKRNLSVHFMLDVDGTIYQTLDLQERAWHGGTANDRSVGIEIAHIGAYPAPGHPVMRSWYEDDAGGTRVTLPKWMEETGIRTPDFVARPMRAGLIERTIQGRRLWMYDYTREQHRALAKLTAALHRVLPEIALDVPRDAAGRPLDVALTDDELAAFRGILGHYHVTTNKIDPGPALDWEMLLGAARRELEDDSMMAAR